MKIIYLASHLAKLNIKDTVIYQDKYIQRDLSGDMLTVDLTPYDIILATPPCNYYARGNYRRELSEYSQKTKHLLPEIINQLSKQNKPFMVENVRNQTLMKTVINNFNGFVYYHGRHTYFTNVLININHIPQIKDNIQNTPQDKRQGGNNVNTVFEYFINYVKEIIYENKN
jgi:site-specific DNA-cytosine methylase